MTTPKKPPTAVTPQTTPPATSAQPKPSPTPTPTPTPAPTKEVRPATSADVPPVASMSPETVESTLQGLRDLTTYQPNVLTQFSNKAYHVRLFMTPDRDVIRSAMGDEATPKSVKDYYSFLDKWQQVTIAETGATSYNIQNVQIESLVGPNFRSVALNTTSIIMNVVEPHGVTFLDALKNSAVQLKIRDMRKCWYYLEITFKGYSDGEPSANILADEGFENGGRWIWQVQFTDIETKLTTGGGEYKISMIPYAETALDAEGRCVPDMMIAEGNTIKEFFDDLATQLNRAWQIRTANKNYLSYSFKFHGIKARTDIDGKTVENFRLDNDDADLNYIRHQDLQGSSGSGGGGSSSGSSGSSGGSGSGSGSKVREPGTPVADGRAAVLSVFPKAYVTSNYRPPDHPLSKKNPNSWHTRSRAAVDVRPMSGISFSQFVQAFRNKGYAIIEAIDETGSGQSKHATGDHWHIVLGEKKKSSGEKPKDAPSNTVPAPSSNENELPKSPFSGKPRGQFARGTSIDEIVTSVFGCCVEAQKLAKDSKNDSFSPDDVPDTGSEEGKVNDKGFRETVIFRAEPEVRVVTYDPAFNKYGKKIIYHIYGYVTQTPIISRTQILNANNTEVQKRMLATLVKQGLLRKRYDYIYTGMNDSVVDLDLSFNLLWSASLPRLLRNEALTAQSRFDSETVKKYTETQDIIASYGMLAADRAALTETIQSANEREDTETAKKAQEDLANTDAAMAEQRSKLSALRERLRASLPTLNEREAMNGARMFAEDLDVESLPTLNDFAITMQYGQDENKNSLATGVVGQAHNGRSIYGAIVNQLEGPMTSQMLSIQMKIVGDPYWMGPANMEQVIIRANETNSDKMADFTIGDNVFTLVFGYPLGENEDGSPKIKNSELFTGLYRVTKVTHEFNNGSFYQNLEAIRMPLIDLYRATSPTESK